MITAEKLRFIFEHYGEEKQLIQLKEELNELIDEINYILRVVKPDGNDEFLGEVADVLVVCEQFRLKYNKVNIIKDYKINRQISRIKKSEEVKFEQSKDFCIDEFVKQEKPKKLKYKYVCKSCKGIKCTTTLPTKGKPIHCGYIDANWKLKGSI